MSGSGVSFLKITDREGAFATVRFGTTATVSAADELPCHDQARCGQSARRRARRDASRKNISMSSPLRRHVGRIPSLIAPTCPSCDGVSPFVCLGVIRNGADRRMISNLILLRLAGRRTPVTPLSDANVKYYERQGLLSSHSRPLAAKESPAMMVQCLAYPRPRTASHLPIATRVRDRSEVASSLDKVEWHVYLRQRCASHR